MKNPDSAEHPEQSVQSHPSEHPDVTEQRMGFSQSRNVYVAGATGLVGSHLVRALSEVGDLEVSALVRRIPHQQTGGAGEDSAGHSRLHYVEVDYEDPSTYPEVLGPVYCCLGTTMKKAGSREAFEKVDYHYPLNLARRCEEAGTPFHIITALGSDPKSGIYYNSVKGRLEEELKKLDLTLHIYRPSLLLGDRNEFRAGESVGAAVAFFLNPLLLGGLRKYRAIHASDVAQAMAAEKEASGVHIYESDDLIRLAGSQ